MTNPSEPSPSPSVTDSLEALDFPWASVTLYPPGSLDGYVDAQSGPAVPSKVSAELGALGISTPSPESIYERIIQDGTPLGQQPPPDNELQTHIVDMSFTEPSRIVQMPGESPEDLHERLAPNALAEMRVISDGNPVNVRTGIDYTVALDGFLEDVPPGTVVLCPSGCVHERPFDKVVGVRTGTIRMPDGKTIITLGPIGRELSEVEKRVIYDAMAKMTSNASIPER